MATSGSVGFQQTAQTIILDAFTDVTSFPTDQAMAAADSAFCLRRLNAMVKTWAAQGIHLWKVRDVTLFLVGGQAKYALGGANGANATDALTTTTLFSDAAANQAVVTPTTRDPAYAVGGFIGLRLDDGTLHWSTIGSIASGLIRDDLTLDLGLPSAATAGNTLLSYPSASQRPQRITEARKAASDGNETQMRLMSRSDYMQLADKSSAGTPHSIYYDPQLTTGQVYLYPTPTDDVETVKFTAETVIEDFSALSDNADFPAEWTQALVRNLAYDIAPSYGVTGQVLGELKNRADESLDLVLSYDLEYAPVTFSPNLTGPSGY